MLFDVQPQRVDGEHRRVPELDEQIVLFGLKCLKSDRDAHRESAAACAVQHSTRVRRALRVWWCEQPPRCPGAHAADAGGLESVEFTQQVRRRGIPHRRTECRVGYQHAP